MRELKGTLAKLGEEMVGVGWRSNVCGRMVGRESGGGCGGSGGPGGAAWIWVSIAPGNPPLPGHLTFLLNYPRRAIHGLEMKILGSNEFHSGSEAVKNDVKTNAGPALASNWRLEARSASRAGSCGSCRAATPGRGCRTPGGQPSSRHPALYSTLGLP